MWTDTPSSPPSTCACCGRSGAAIGPYWHVTTLTAPLGLPYERPHAVYICRRCLVVAMCHPHGPLPELDPQSFEADMASMRQVVADLPERMQELSRLTEVISHQERVIAAYEEAERTAPPTPELNVDALAAAVAEKVREATAPRRRSSAKEAA